MSSADKKRRHEAERKQKRLASRRRESISPIKRLADAPGEIECWISDDLQAVGQMQIFVYKRAGGLTGLACFLIDRGVVGLKDAWFRMHLERDELEEALERTREHGILMRPGTVDEARRWIAGGLRWAHENGMRLPKDWAKTASLLGGVGDWTKADVSAFIKEFAGHPEDLRQRLIGEPFDSYLERDDIQFIFNSQVTYMDQETGDYIPGDPAMELLDEEDDEMTEEVLEAMDAALPKEELDVLASQFNVAAEALALNTSTWLKARNDQPSSELSEAWRALMVATTVAKVALGEDQDEEAFDQLGYELLEDLTDEIPESRKPDYRRAVEQALKHLQVDPLVMHNAVSKYAIGQ